MPRSNDHRGRGDNRLAVLADEVKAAHGDILRASETIADRALKAGQALIEAKASLGHGKFGPWLEEIGLPARTATRYMTLAKAGVSSAMVADLGIVAAAKRAGEIMAAPLPESGEVIEGRDADDRLLFIWQRDEFSAYYLNHVVIDFGGGFIDGAAKGVRRDFLHQMLLHNERLTFDFASATYERRDYSGALAELLEREQQAFSDDAAASWKTWREAPPILAVRGS